jgi:hypothetical protein
MKPVTARVWPHNHTSEFGGPLDVKIGVTSQPEILRGWKKPPLFSLEQPSDESNLTLLRILFLKHGSKPREATAAEYHTANVWGLQALPVTYTVDPLTLTQDQQVEYNKAWNKAKPSHLTVYLKARYTDALPHPVPLGKWEGTVEEDEHGRWVLFTLQAMTLAVQKVEEKRHILIPGDPEWAKTYKPI